MESWDVHGSIQWFNDTAFQPAVASDMQTSPVLIQALTQGSSLSNWEIMPRFWVLVGPSVKLYTTQGLLEGIIWAKKKNPAVWENTSCRKKDGIANESVARNHFHQAVLWVPPPLACTSSGFNCIVNSSCRLCPWSFTLFSARDEFKQR